MGSSVSLVSQRRRFAVAAPLAAALVATFAILLQPGLSLPLRQSISGLGLLLAGVVAAVSGAVRASQTVGRRRRSWRLLMSAAVVAVAGNLWVSVTGADPVASPSAIGNGSIAVALVLSIAGLLTFPSVQRRGIEQLLMALDGLVAGSAVLVIASVLVYGELLASVTDDLAARSAALLFPVLDVVLATVAILLLLRTTGSDRPALGLVTAGFLTYAVSDLAFAVLAAQDRFHFGTVLDLGWIAGYLLIALAAWYPSDQADGAPEQGEGESSDARGTMVVVGVLLVAGVVQVAFGEGGQMPAAEAAMWLVLILSAGARQVLLATDNAALRRGLEQRVREQTADLTRLARQNEVLLTSVGDGIYGVDDGGRITFVNPSAASALGYAPQDLLGLRAHEAFHAPDEDGAPYPWSGCYINDAIRSGVVASAEEDVYTRSDGRAFPVEITASPLVDGEEVRGAVVVFRDVTQRREVDRMKNEFLSVVSHELRTPLTSIRGSLGLLAGGKLGELPPRADALVGTALQSSERLTRLINDLLDIERIESGTRPMEIATLDVCALLTQAASAIEGFASATRVRIELGPCAGRVLADEDRVMQTLTNLLGNAIKYSEPGGVVTMDATERPGHVLFRVQDHGRGIPEDKLESVFERFEQVDSSDARQKGGTGLGLAISRGIVERHGGRIWAESELGVGTTVLFTLPALPVPRAGSEPAPPTHEGAILLVEDDADLAGVITALLGDAGLEVVVAGSAEEAVARGRELRPRAVVLDLRVPDGDGAAVVAAFRRDRALAHATLVVYSADDVPQEHRAGLELGRTAFLTKGRVPPEELRDRLLDLMGSTAGRQRGHARG